VPDLRWTGSSVDDDEVYASRKAAQLDRHEASRGHRGHRSVEMADLASVDTFLGLAEAAARRAANLDKDEFERRPLVDRYQVDLVAADAHVSRDGGPAHAAQVRESGVLGDCPSPLPLRRHD